MFYQEYSSYPDKTYILVRYKGSGFMEDPHRDPVVLGGYDTAKEAREAGDALHLSDWEYGLDVDINTLTEEGRERFAKFEEQGKQMSAFLDERKAAGDPDYFEQKIGEHVWRGISPDTWKDTNYFGNNFTTKLLVLNPDGIRATDRSGPEGGPQDGTHAEPGATQ